MKTAVFALLLGAGESALAQAQQLNALGGADHNCPGPWDNDEDTF